MYSMLKESGRYFKRHQGVYILQCFNKTKSALDPAKFVHLIVQGESNVTCDCKAAEFTECEHIKVWKSRLLDFDKPQPIISSLGNVHFIFCIFH